MSYVVTGPLAVVHIGDKIQYLYAGAVVPDGVDPAEVDRLVGRGLVSSADPVDVGKPKRVRARTKPEDNPDGAGDGPDGAGQQPPA